MRLTLRTLLAYLDDTLDPGQTRVIGQKLTESDVARELVDRIRKVTRRRGLTVPTADTSDANIVAKYLDNDLPADKIAEVEEQALRSDVHLAEIAACHQLLTLIMSEPAKVPPSARQRMYALVKGREMDPTRRAPRVASATLAPEEPLAEDDEAHPLVSRRGGKKRILAAGLLSLLLIAAVWIVIKQSEQSATTKPSSAPVAENKTTPPQTPKEAPNDGKNETVMQPADKSAPPDQPKERATPTEQPKEDPPKPETSTSTPQPPKPNESLANELEAARKTSEERTEVGKSASSNGLLIQSVHEGAEWQRIPANSSLTGLTRLLSLPGLVNEVRLGNAVIVEVFGQVPEIQPDSFESVIRIFAAPMGFDADVRLERGRAYIRAAKPTGAKVRLRMSDDILDVTFADDQSEIICDLAGTVAVLRGEVKVRPNLKPEIALKAAPGPVLLVWQPGAGWADKPVNLTEPAAVWLKTRTANGPGREQAQEMDALLKRAPKLLGDDKKDLRLAVSELAYERPSLGRRLASYCQAALDDLPPLIDALEDQVSSDSRQGAVTALSHWLTRSPDQAAKLQDGLVTRKGMTNAQANRVIKLLYGFDDMELRDPKTYARLIEDLCDERLAVRELSIWRLNQFDPDGGRAIRYLPTDTNEGLQRARTEWKRRIPDGTLPARTRS